MGLMGRSDLARPAGRHGRKGRCHHAEHFLNRPCVMGVPRRAHVRASFTPNWQELAGGRIAEVPISKGFSRFAPYGTASGRGATGGRVVHRWPRLGSQASRCGSSLKERGCSGWLPRPSSELISRPGATPLPDPPPHLPSPRLRRTRGGGKTASVLSRPGDDHLSRREAHASQLALTPPLERQQHVHDLLSVSRLLVVGDLASAAVGDAGLGDL